tara:strand:+ start:315 stop:740 length:426 start_codon:yes stop_codon:yes gene_type:complete
VFLTDKMLRQMIAEIKDEYLTQLPGNYEDPRCGTENAMENFSCELDEIEIDSSEGVNFMGNSMSYEELISIVGNYVASHEQRHSGGAPMKQLRDGIKGAIRDALSDVPQMIADALAEELEPYIEDDDDHMMQYDQDDMGEF